MYHNNKTGWPTYHEVDAPTIVLRSLYEPRYEFLLAVGVRQQVTHAPVGVKHTQGVTPGGGKQVHARKDALQQRRSLSVRVWARNEEGLI